MKKTLMLELVKELKQFVKAALDRDDFEAVAKYSKFIRALQGEEGKPAKQAKAKIGRPAKPKKIKAVKVKAAKKAVEKAAPPKTAPAAPAPKARAGRKSKIQHPVGTVLSIAHKKAHYEIKVVEGGVEYKGVVYPSLSNLVDSLFGKGKVLKLRLLKNWALPGAEKPAKKGKKPGRKPKAGKRRGRKPKNAAPAPAPTPTPEPAPAQ